MKYHYYEDYALIDLLTQWNIETKFILYEVPIASLTQLKI